MMSTPHDAQFSVSLSRVLWILLTPKDVPFGSKNSNNRSQEATNQSWEKIGFVTKFTEY